MAFTLEEMKEFVDELNKEEERLTKEEREEREKRAEQERERRELADFDPIGELLEEINKGLREEFADLIAESRKKREEKEEREKNKLVVVTI